MVNVKKLEQEVDELDFIINFCEQNLEAKSFEKVEENTNNLPVLVDKEQEKEIIEMFSEEDNIKFENYEKIFLSPNEKFIVTFLFRQLLFHQKNNFKKL